MRTQALTNAEINYAQIEKGFLGIVYTWEKFNQFVYVQPIYIKSDPQPLEAVIRKPISSTKFWGLNFGQIRSNVVKKVKKWALSIVFFTFYIRNAF